MSVSPLKIRNDYIGYSKALEVGDFKIWISPKLDDKELWIESPTRVGYFDLKGDPVQILDVLTKYCGWQIPDKKKLLKAIRTVIHVRRRQNKWVSKKK